jgi:hypothetical protein
MSWQDILILAWGVGFFPCCLAYLVITDWLDVRAGRFSRWLDEDSVRRWKALGYSHQGLCFVVSNLDMKECRKR